MIHGFNWKPIPFGTGGSIVMWKNYSALLEAGYDIKLFKIGDGKSKTNYPEALVNDLPEYSTIHLRQGRSLYLGRITQWLNPVFGVINGYYPPDTSTNKICRSADVYKNLKPHIILAENAGAAKIAQKIWPKSKIIVCIHDLDPHLSFEKNKTRLRKDWKKSRLVFNKLFYRWCFFCHWLSFLLLLRKMKGIIIIGRGMLNHLIIYRKKIFFSPVVLPPSERSYDKIITFREDYLKNHKKRIIYIGNLNNSHTRKSLPKILENILPNLIKKFGENYFIFRVIGNKTGAEDMISKYGKYPCVNFTGFIEDIEDEYLKAFCQLVPEGHNTGVRVKIVESLSYGVPVVTSRNELKTLGLDNDEGCLIANNSQEYINVISSLIKEEVNLKIVSQQAFRTYESKFDANCVIPLLADFIESYKR